MADTILLLGHGKDEGRRLALDLRALGYEPIASVWSEFSPRAFGRDRPALILADVDRKTAVPMDRLAAEVRRLWGDQFPVIAVTSANKFKDLSALLDAGASACLARGAPIRLLERKLARCLVGGGERGGNELTGEVPCHLLSVFADAKRLIPLGELAAIYPGAAPRRPGWRRMAPPEEGWRGVLTADVVERFHIGRPDAYLRWSRLALFRLPPRGEYDVAEKVLLRRAGPPLVAAVDRSRLPAGMGVYSLVPAEGVSAGYIACLLNSRLLDFYFNRIAPPGSDGRLRPEEIGRVPVPRPDGGDMQEFSRAATLLTHFGPNPETWIDRQSKDEWLEQMESMVFALYGAGSEVREGLAAMHF